MDLVESFLTAVDSLLTHKLRAILTMLGVIIGVAAVIAVVSIVQGLSQTVNAQFEGLGSNTLTISGIPLRLTMSIKKTLPAPMIIKITATLRSSLLCLSRLSQRTTIAVTLINTDWAPSKLLRVAACRKSSV
mgnify:CR=1 FL=1